MRYLARSYFIGIITVGLFATVGCGFWGGKNKEVQQESTTNTSLENVVTITETTVGSLEGCSVGVSNIWKDDNGKLGASLSFSGCPSKNDNGEVRVYEGQQIKIGGNWLLVDAVKEGKNQRGSVRIGRLPQVVYELNPENVPQEFYCSGLEGFVFTYPVFKGWEPTSDELKAKNGQCTILLNYFDLLSNNKVGDRPPQIKISKEYYHGVPGEMEPPSSFSSSTKNPQGIPYFRKDNYGAFWIENAVVKVELIGIVSGYNFSEKLFWEQVIKTFTLKEPNPVS